MFDCIFARMTKGKSAPLLYDYFKPEAILISENYLFKYIRPV
jgi:hypothetical protein